MYSLKPLVFFFCFFGWICCVGALASGCLSSCKDILLLVLQVLSKKVYLVKLCCIYFFTLFISMKCFCVRCFHLCSGKKAKGTKPYRPQRNTAAYALLITLHRFGYMCIFLTLYSFFPLIRPFFRTVMALWFFFLPERLQMGKNSCVNKSLWTLLTLVDSHTFLLRMIQIMFQSLMC